MEDKKDGVAEAAKKARGVAERLLPGRPHHLTINPNRKYPPPSGFWFTGMSSRLQYLTNLSDADRGVLLTVPFFEIMDEPETANPVKTVPTTGEGKKKMSMKDYKARKKSLSPTENEAAAKTDAKQDAPAETSAAKEKVKGQESRSKETNGHPIAKPEKAEKPRPEQTGERTTIPPKSETKKPTAQDTRKRPPEPEETSPPQKKPRTGDATSRPDPGGEAKTSSQRSREPPRDRSTLKEMRDGKSARASTPSQTANGRLQVTNDKDKDLSSPRSTIMVNGTRSRAGSSTSTPRKGDKGDAPKRSIPPLLSPPFQMDRGEDAPSPRKKPAGKTPLKGVIPPGHSRSNSATKPPIPDLMSPIHIDLDDDRESPAKKLQERSKAKLPTSGKGTKRSRLLIPPLLSPTLPPVVEQDLARNPPPKGISISPVPPTSATGTAKAGKPVVGPKMRPADSSVRSRIVVLKYKKALKARVHAILSLPSKATRQSLRKERSASEERIPPARKRPLDAASEAPPKRSRPSAEVLQSKPAPPTTPLKNSATSMMRVLSNTSQANTPGDSTHLTPGGAPERPPTSSTENLDPAVLARSAAQRDRFAKHNKLGSTLKHRKDALVGKNRGPPNTVPDAENKRAAALHFEMVLSYMIAFKALDTSRRIERKPGALETWESLLPHFHELRMRVHRNSALTALAAQIHALCLEEYCQAFTGLDERTAGAMFHRWVRYAKKKREVWEEAMALVNKVEDGKMKYVFGPWMAVEDAVGTALVVMRRWASAEGVDWKAELDVPV